MPIANWSVPFVLTSSVYDPVPLSINTPETFTAGSGIYLLRPGSCKLRTSVRATKENVPQEDGSILHRRFVSGCEMDLAVQLWQSTDMIACDTLLQEMLDRFMGYAYGLLNAGDNEGRIAWLPDGNSSATSAYRMLDDIRLWTYPEESQNPGQPYELALTVDCALPYAQDLTPNIDSLAGGGGTVNNLGNRPVYPVWRIHGPFDAFTLTDGTQEFTYDGTLSGAVTVGSGDYLEINTFNNTAYKNGSGSNLKPGIVMTDSEFFLIPSGESTITISYTNGGANNSLSEGETNNAWA